jgi:hypothetical protein
MIISDEQARLAAQYLSTREAEFGGGHEEVSEDVLARAIAVIQQTPETRSERILEARQHLAVCPDSHAVAGKMISRFISDSLR